MKKQSKSIILFSLLAFLSASCGGSGNGQVASGGIGGTGISQGTIDDFGSIILNGLEFNTDNADFIIDDNDPRKGEARTLLRKGMQVTVRVDASGNTATAVEFEAEVEGPIDVIDPANNSLTVLGRKVVIDASTKIEDNATTPATLTLAQLKTSDMLEVSGLVLPDGSIQATYIRKRNDITVGPGTELELKGSITSVNTAAKTLVIAGLTIDYGSVPATFDRMIESDLASGVLIEAKGTRASVGAALVASEIKKEDRLGANEADKLEIEGVVTSPVPVNSSAFELNGQAVTTSSATTTFEGGAADDIISNVRLEVEGTLTNDVLVASKVKFRGNRIKIEADVETTGTSPNSITLLGQPVVINGLTRMDGISFANIVGTTVRLEIRGYLSKGVVTATRVRTRSGGNVTLQAPIEAILAGDLTLLGNKVTTAGVITFRDVDGSKLTSEQFFAKIIAGTAEKAGTVVKVKGPLNVNGTTIEAREIEIEN